MSCCNQALTRFANNVKGIAHPWTLQIKTRPEQKNEKSAARQLHRLRNVLWISNSSRGGSGPALSPRSPSMFPFFHREGLSWATNPRTSLRWDSHLSPAWLEGLVVFFWGMSGKANNTSIHPGVIWSLNSGAGGGWISDQTQPLPSGTGLCVQEIEPPVAFFSCPPSSILPTPREQLRCVLFIHRCSWQLVIWRLAHA